MTTTPPIHNWHHEKGYEIPTKHKEAIRELAAFGNKSVKQLANRYKLRQLSIRRVLNYKAPERARPEQTGRKALLSDRKLDEVIKYYSEK
jgi:hypothetical protein